MTCEHSVALRTHLFKQKKILKVIFRKTVLTNCRFLAHLLPLTHCRSGAQNRVPWEDVESDDDDDEPATNGSEVSTTIKIQALPSPSTALAFVLLLTWTSRQLRPPRRRAQARRCVEAIWWTCVLRSVSCIVSISALFCNGFV